METGKWRPQRKGWFANNLAGPLVAQGDCDRMTVSRLLFSPLSNTGISPMDPPPRPETPTPISPLTTRRCSQVRHAPTRRLAEFPRSPISLPSCRYLGYVTRPESPSSLLAEPSSCRCPQAAESTEVSSRRVYHAPRRRCPSLPTSRAAEPSSRQGCLSPMLPSRFLPSRRGVLRRCPISPMFDVAESRISPIFLLTRASIL
jgi:hypothetical protein